MKTQRLICLAVSALAVTLAAGRALAVEPGVSDKLGVSTYIQRTTRVTLVADSYVASLRKSDGFIPIRIAVGVSGRGKPIRLGQESFTLIDEKGHEAPLAPYGKLQSDYENRTADETLFRERPMMLDDRFDALRRIDSSFYPAPGGRGTRTTEIELPNGTWFQDVLYFERPPAGVSGVLTLKLRARALDRSVSVRFKIEHASAEDRPASED